MGLELTFPDGAALVAGGTGNVGAGVARTLAGSGLPVTFTYRGSEERARELEAELRDAGARAQAVCMDMGDPASIDAALDAAETFGGPVRTVAGASGAVVPFNRIADFSVAEIEGFLADDAMGYYRLVHRAVPRLRANGGGSITLTTSVAVDRVLRFDGISPFSKGAVRALVRQVAFEEAEHGIRCNDVAIAMTLPGSFDDAAAFAGTLPPPYRERLGALLDQLRSQIRLGRPSTAAEAGNLYAFLASDQASFVTGQSIALDGGLTL